MVNPAKTLGKLVKHANDNTLFEITDVVDAKLSGRRMSDGTTFTGVPMNKLLGARRGDLIIGDILRAKSKLSSPTLGDVIILDADTSRVPYIFKARRVASAPAVSQQQLQLGGEQPEAAKGEDRRGRGRKVQRLIQG